MAYTIKSWVDGNRVYAVDINKWEKGIDDAHNEKLDKTSYTATDVLTKVKTVDGAGSGLDADLLDGQQGTYYASATALTDGLALKLNSSAYTANDVRTKLLTVDGSGSGVDADLLDGLHASSFALSTHTQDWSTIDNKPSTFPPSTHKHVWADITGTLPEYATRPPSWSEITSKPITFAPSAHNQDWSTITDKPTTATRWPTWSEVTSKPTTFTPSAHSQSWSTITDKPAQATRWPSWAEVTGKPTLISYGTSVPSTLAHNTIFVKI